MRGMNFLSTPHSSPASVVALSFDLARALPAQAKPAPAPGQVYDLGSLTDDAAELLLPPASDAWAPTVRMGL